MRTTKTFKRFLTEFFLGIYFMTNIIPIGFISQTFASYKNTKVDYPLKEVSKLNCRFNKFNELESNCKQKLPILHTKEYEKYIKIKGGYNEYTRYYTTLWGASYKYGWDVGFGGHEGTDIATSKGTPVYAIADGKVILAKRAYGWGNVVTIEHFIYGKKVYSNYAHLSKISVKKGDKIKLGKKIGEVGSTGNSTGNHLHLQIDLNTPFHPFYYNHKTCNYSYHDITEKGVCFDELTKNTIDPLLFIETNGKILEQIKTVSTKKVKFSKKNNSTKNKNITKNINTKKTYIKKSNISIWKKTVYKGYPKGDIREVQQILRDLKLYNGDLTGNYNDIENIIFNYQVKNSIVKNKSDLGAGRFGPKTRTSLKKSYDNFIKNGGEPNYIVIKNKNSITTTIPIKKIKRDHILTREEIEEKEYKNFIKNNNFDLKINGENIYVGKSATINFAITKKHKKNKIFKGITPLNVSIITDNNILKVFPKKISYFRDGAREIKITGLKPGITNIKIKFGPKIIKTYKIRVISKNEKIQLKTGKVFGKTNLVIGEQGNGIAIFSDNSKKRLVGIKYNGNYKIIGEGNTKVCIKKGNKRFLSKIFKRKCLDGEFKKEITFNYNDTVSGLLIFGYKANGKKASFKIINTNNNLTLVNKKLAIKEPRGLKKNYVYYNETLNLLKKGIIKPQNNGTINVNKGLNQKDALDFIEETLKTIRNNRRNKKVVNKKIYLVHNSIPKNKKITRKDFIVMLNKYLNLDNTNGTEIKKYIDVKDEKLKKNIAFIFDKQTSWKDKFGKNYFQPNKEISLGEVAYLINKAIEKNNNIYLTLK